LKKLLLPNRLYLPLPYVKKAPYEFIKAFISFLIIWVLLLHFDPLSIGTSVPYKETLMEYCDSATVSATSKIAEIVVEHNRKWDKWML